MNWHYKETESASYCSWIGIIQNVSNELINLYSSHFSNHPSYLNLLLCFIVLLVSEIIFDYLLSQHFLHIPSYRFMPNEISLRSIEGTLMSLNIKIQLKWKILLLVTSMKWSLQHFSKGFYYFFLYIFYVNLSWWLHEFVYTWLWEYVMQPASKFEVHLINKVLC